MLELAASGAKILHLRCVEYARRYDVPLSCGRRSRATPAR
jgi:aspartokinase